MKRLNQQGSHLVALVLAFVVLGVVGFSGYKVWQSRNSAAPISTTAASSSAPQAITTKADLTQAGKALDSSAAQVDSSVNSAALDSDINDLL